MDGETHIIAKINGKQVTVSESSIMWKLKLKDEEGMSDLPNTDLFANLSLMGYNILPNQRFSFQKDEPASPPRDDSHGEALPYALELRCREEDRKKPYTKTSSMPHESSLRVTSLGGDEGNRELKTLEDAQTTRGDVQEDAPNRGE
ncbi:hypothetical protein Tco_0345179 [Tanacetum coccineum]|uniref:Uncharacterized protein n=1 Tax=Tanacetum coccineum TaxID=301880 RepID=A0ABQ4Y4E1_9ASTR